MYNFNKQWTNSKMLQYTILPQLFLSIVLTKHVANRDTLFIAEYLTNCLLTSVLAENRHNLCGIFDKF